MANQEQILKFIRHNPALSISTLEKEAEIPRQTITRALNEGRAIPEKHLNQLLPVITKYGYSPTLYQKARVISVVNHKGGSEKLQLQFLWAKPWLISGLRSY